MNYEENPEITHAQEYGEKGYWKTHEQSETQKRSENEIVLTNRFNILDPSYNITYEDIAICNHQNFKGSNMLILASALLIITEYKNEGLKVSEVDESIINQYADFIFKLSDPQYKRRYNLKEVYNRLNFSILSYILLVENTKKQIQAENRKIIKLSIMFQNEDKYNEYLEKQMNYEDKIEEQSNDFDLEYELETSKKKDEVITDELLKIKIIKQTDDYKIIKFIYGTKFISIKTFFQELANNSFINSFVKEIKDLYPFFGIEFIPFTSQNYEIDFEIYVYKTIKTGTKINKYKKYMSPDKLATTFRLNKEIFIIPVDDSSSAKYPGIFSNLSIFLNNAKPEQIRDIFRQLSKAVKQNIQKNNPIYITTNTEKNDWLSFKINFDSKHNQYKGYK